VNVQLQEATDATRAATEASQTALEEIRELASSFTAELQELMNAQIDATKAAMDAAKAAQGAARTAQASSWAAQKDATRAGRASMRAMQITEGATKEVEDWDEGSGEESTTWDQLAMPADETDPEEKEFWDKVPEHLGDGTLMDDEDPEWIEKLRKKWPFGQKEEDSSEEDSPSPSSEV